MKTTYIWQLWEERTLHTVSEDTVWQNFGKQYGDTEQHCHLCRNTESKLVSVHH